jgi:hypothetical protein
MSRKIYQVVARVSDTEKSSDGTCLAGGKLTNDLNKVLSSLDAERIKVKCTSVAIPVWYDKSAYLVRCECIVLAKVDKPE